MEKIEMLKPDSRQHQKQLEIISGKVIRVVNVADTVREIAAPH